MFQDARCDHRRPISVELGKQKRSQIGFIQNPQKVSRRKLVRGCETLQTWDQFPNWVIFTRKPGKFSENVGGNASVVKSRVSNPHFQAFPGMPNVQFNEKSEFLSRQNIWNSFFTKSERTLATDLVFVEKVFPLLRLFRSAPISLRIGTGLRSCIVGDKKEEI